MEERKPIESNLSKKFAPYAFGGRTKAAYRDMMTGRLIVVSALEAGEETLAYQDIRNLRTANRMLSRELAESELTRSQLEKALPLKKSIEGTGEKMIGYVVSSHPTNGNRKGKKILRTER
jgi:hypothetical protein